MVKVTFVINIITTGSNNQRLGSAFNNMKQRQQGIFIRSESAIFSHRITVMTYCIKGKK